MKAIFIDAVNHTVDEIDLPYEEVGFRIINQTIGCDTFSMGYTFPTNDVLYVDDEGLLGRPEHFFVLDGYDQPFAGNGLIMGGDEWGEAADVKVTADQIRVKVLFTNAAGVRAWFQAAEKDRARRMAAMQELGANLVSAPYPEV